ncbi:uncharacterized protein LOC132263398 [Phlebotomus argentipes]|uniref:uncharacterized protein LOC132263398 n=1 Tax=Phlebotomus argentipes TaxID=94469 RepID=UPI0028936575|nr:uncharacterized protein LOC132263398 [Phlebotomus argentipes]
MQLSITRADKNHQSYIYQSGIINEVLYETKDRILIRQEAFDRREKDFARFYNVLVCDSYKSFNKILDVMSVETYDYTGFYTIIMTGIADNYTEIAGKMLEEFWLKNIVNVNVATYAKNDTEKAIMYTYFPFTPSHCGRVKPVVWGVLENGTFTTNGSIFPEKVNNLHRCNLTVGTFDFPPYMKLTPHGNGSYYYDGFEGIVTRVLGQRLNFSLILKTDDARWGWISEDGKNSTGIGGMVKNSACLRATTDLRVTLESTGTGINPPWMSLECLLRGEVNFTVGSFATTYAHYGFLTTTISYHATSLTMLIPPGRPYTPLETLFHPMKYIIWSCIGSIFIASAVLVAATQFTTPQRRAFIFGHGNHHPFINTINVFLGGCVSVTPRRNFARFLLMVWILMSLVIRSSYQGALFKILKENRNASAADTLSKMHKQGLKIYGVDSLKKYFTTEPYNKMYVPISAQELDDYRERSSSPDFDGVVVTPALNIAYLNEKHSNEHVQYRRAKEQVVTLYYCIFLRKYSYLMKPFDKELWKYVESGLINRWTSIFYNIKYLKEVERKSGLKPLTLDQLSGIFAAYAILLSLSFVVFLLEMLSRKLRFLAQLFNFLN